MRLPIKQFTQSEKKELLGQLAARANCTTAMLIALGRGMPASQQPHFWHSVAMYSNAENEEEKERLFRTALYNLQWYQ